MINLTILTSEPLYLKSILHYFKDFSDVNISCIITNNKNSSAIKTAKLKSIKRYVIKSFITVDKIIQKHNIHYIITDNFNNIIPPNFVKKYKGKIINIHQSLLPKYSGKDFLNNDKIYTEIIHKKDNNAGISIYIVDENYHTGKILFKKEFNIKDYNFNYIKQNILELAYKFYPIIIDKYIYRTFNLYFKKSF